MDSWLEIGVLEREITKDMKNSKTDITTSSVSFFLKTLSGQLGENHRLKIEG